MYEAGRRSAEAEMAAAWARVTAVVRGPDLAEIEERRWGPGGRAHFADPRPGDFPGRTVQPNRKQSSNWRQDDNRRPAEPGPAGPCNGSP